MQEPKRRGRPPKANGPKNFAEAVSIPPKEGTCEVVVMAPNMWWDGEKHLRRTRLTMTQEDADRLISEDQEAEREERVMVL